VSFETLQILVIEIDSDAAAGLAPHASASLALRAGLAQEGWVITVVRELTSIASDSARRTADVIIIHCESSWLDAFRLLFAPDAQADRATVIFTNNPDAALARRAVEAGVAAYVVAGLSADRVRSVVEIARSRFDELCRLQQGLAKARSDLDERVLLDRAKGLLTSALGISEVEAHQRIRRLAMDQQQSLASAAAKVIEAAQRDGRR
jgi:two-component system, response regulator / RNA-binding antiterminator